MGHVDTAMGVRVGNTLRTVTTGDMLWSHAGERGLASVTTDGHVYVNVIKGADNVPVTTWGDGGWASALRCDYCTRPATHITRGSDDEIVCVHCARQQYDRPAEWVRPMSARDIRTKYAAAYCE